MCPARGCEMVDKIAYNVVKDCNKKYIRYSTVSLNIRKKPNSNSKILGFLRYGQKIQIQKCNSNWVVLIKGGKKVGFVNKKYITKKEPKYKLYWIPEYSGYKSFMDYRKITDESSPQWRLQEDRAYTGDYGIRMINGRFCVAIGFAFDPKKKSGNIFDLVLENGTTIPCIVSDEKATEDTTDNMYTTDNGCYTEFVIDIDNLHRSSAISGDISSICNKWDSPVEKIKMYRKNVLEE